MTDIKGAGKKRRKKPNMVPRTLSGELNPPPGTITWRPAKRSHSSLSFQAVGWQRAAGRGWQSRAEQSRAEPEEFFRERAGQRGKG